MVQQAALSLDVSQDFRRSPLQETFYHLPPEQERMHQQLDGLTREITLLTQLVEQQKLLIKSLMDQKNCGPNCQNISEKGITVVVNTDKAKGESSSYLSPLTKRIAKAVALYIAFEYVLPAVISSVMQSGVPTAQDVASGLYLPGRELSSNGHTLNFASGAATFVLEAASNTAETAKTVFSELTNGKGLCTQAYEAIKNSVSDRTTQLLIDSGEVLLDKAESLGKRAFWFVVKGAGSLYALKKTPSIIQGAFRSAVIIIAPGVARRMGM